MAVFLALLICRAPTLSADPSWIEITPFPSQPVLLRSGAHSHALVRLTLVNRAAYPVRVQGVRVAYVREDRIVGAEPPEAVLIGRDYSGRPDRIERGARIAWEGICLSHVPEGAERIRFDLDLLARSDLQQLRSSARIEVPLRVLETPLALSLPFRGYWRVTQGHGCHTHHRLGGFGEDFAWDFVAVDPKSGSSVSDGFARTRRNRDTVTFGQSVLAPADGKIVRVVDGVNDNEGLLEYPGRSLLEDLGQPLWIFGNFVVIDAGHGEYVLLGHLERGSIRVAAGAQVHAGEPIAAAGNSGSSVEPHLHVQLMDHADPADPGVAGIPAVFHDYLEVTSRSHAQRRDTNLRRVDRGDPPEGAAVATARDLPAP